MNQMWDLRFLELAKLVASWSKDSSTKVGCVIVESNKSVVSLGYNGLARGVIDTEERLNNREVKYKIIQHAEKNAITFADRGRLEGSVIYTWPFMPCAQCAGQIIQAGIHRVVSVKNDNPRWQEDFKLSLQMFNECLVNTRSMI